jgi:hypothetical protein
LKEFLIYQKKQRRIFWINLTIKISFRNGLLKYGCLSGKQKTNKPEGETIVGRYKPMLYYPQKRIIVVVIKESRINEKRRLLNHEISNFDSENCEYQSGNFELVPGSRKHSVGNGG